ncbi:rRNA-processing protein UTP23 homolog isoform X2 [Homalodisca vitripennis]|uniref:rRNA-processing protein UTP23 homolog isoform X2 n=1 Tax=Homalodisca vitripennis TaxID=197043 RepID=UPI001EEBEBA9|nr:rRNA-processing protein UTP23 homolog isoform X2 [Homalodisca vitripennis]
MGSNFRDYIFGLGIFNRSNIDGKTFKMQSNKLNIQEQLPKYLGDVKLLTTPCVIVETELLGKVAFGAMRVVKQFSVHRCSHTNQPVSGSQCFQSMLGENNPSRYIIATQDRDLQEIVRNIPGTPLIYLHQRTPHLEEPSPLTARMALEKTNQRFGVSQLDSMKLSALKTATFGEETKVTSKKRKMKGGPNPLSCKKKKKSLAGNKEPITTENSDKPRRKRKRIKLAKHVKEYLIHNSC